MEAKATTPNKGIGNEVACTTKHVIKVEHRYYQMISPSTSITRDYLTLRTVREHSVQSDVVGVSDSLSNQCLIVVISCHLLYLCFFEWHQRSCSSYLKGV